MYENAETGNVAGELVADMHLNEADILSFTLARRTGGLQCWPLL